MCSYVELIPQIMLPQAQRWFRVLLVGACAAVGGLIALSCSPSTGAPNTGTTTAGNGGTASSGAGGMSTVGGGGAAVGGSGQCPVGTAPCAGTCVNPSTDAANCGACGNACGATQSCVNGTCSCPPPLLACGQACSNTATDVAHCSACNVACSAGQVLRGHVHVPSGLDGVRERLRQHHVGRRQLRRVRHRLSSRDAAVLQRRVRGHLPGGAHAMRNGLRRRDGVSKRFSELRRLRQSLRGRPDVHGG